jgi:hypothetical protein
MAAEDPTLEALLADAKLNTTPDGIAAIAAYKAAETACENWTQGTSAQNALELIADFQTLFSALPLPPSYELLINLILGGVTAAIGLLTANSPAPVPAPAPTDVAPEVAAHAQLFHAHAVGAATEAKVVALTGIKISAWDKARAAVGDTHVVANRYKSEWNSAVDKGGFPQTLKVA